MGAGAVSGVVASGTLGLVAGGPLPQRRQQARGRAGAQDRAGADAGVGPRSAPSGGPVRRWPWRGRSARARSARGCRPRPPRRGTGGTARQKAQTTRHSSCRALVKPWSTPRGTTTASSSAGEAETQRAAGPWARASCRAASVLPAPAGAMSTVTRWAPTARASPRVTRGRSMIAEPLKTPESCQPRPTGPVRGGSSGAGPSRQSPRMTRSARRA